MPDKVTGRRKLASPPPYGLDVAVEHEGDLLVGELGDLQQLLEDPKLNLSELLPCHGVPGNVVAKCMLCTRIALYAGCRASWFSTSQLWFLHRRGLLQCVIEPSWTRKRERTLVGC